MMFLTDCSHRFGSPSPLIRYISRVIALLLMMIGWGTTTLAETVTSSVTAAPVMLPSGITVPAGTSIPAGINIPTGIMDSTAIQRGAITTGTTEGQPQSPTHADAGDSTISATSPGQEGEDGTHSPSTKENTDSDTLQTSLPTGGEGPVDLEAMFSQAPQQLGQFSTLPNFGYNIFRQASSTFAPSNTAAVGPDYMIGPGDQFVIHIWGRVNGDYPIVVGREGSIVIPQIGKIDVAGLTFGALDAYLTQQVGRVLSDFTLHVTMGQLRTIRIYVVGEVEKPGSYEVSSLTSLYQALFVAGGPSQQGSLRNIQLKRSGQNTVTADLYDFLLKGDRSQDQTLQNGDTIFVPLVKTRIGISGPVKRPAQYEFTTSPTLEQLIATAGGLEPTAWLNKVQVRRIEQNEWHTVLDLDLTQNASPQTHDFKLKNQDLVLIYPIAPSDNQVVRVVGHVAHPGTMAYHPGMTLADLFPNRYKDFLPEPYLGYGEIVRISPPLYEEHVISFHLDAALNGQETVPLQPLDTIRIFSAAFYRAQQSVSIEGSVRHPGSFQFRKGMTLSNLIHDAGDPLPGAFMGRVDISRLNPVGSTKPRRLISVSSLLDLLSGKGKDLQLQAQDVVRVYSREHVEPDAVVTIQGEVQKSGTYPLQDGMRVLDLIYAAGLKRSSYLASVEWGRTWFDGSEVKQERHNLDLSAALKGDENSNPLLQNRDFVVVRPIPEWKEDKTVTLTGEVVFPGVYRLEKDETLSHVISRAGGFTDQAYLPGAIFSRKAVKASEESRKQELIRLQESLIASDLQRVQASGASAKDSSVIDSRLATSKMLIARLQSTPMLGRIVVNLHKDGTVEGNIKDLPLEDGDSLYIPSKPAQVAVLGEVYNPTAFIWDDGLNVTDYLAKAGGSTEQANTDGIYVIKANGSVVSGQSRFFGIGSYHLDPGDTVLVPQALEKEALITQALPWSTLMYNMALSAKVLFGF